MTLPLTAQALHEQTRIPLRQCRSIVKKVGRKLGNVWIARPEDIEAEIWGDGKSEVGREMGREPLPKRTSAPLVLRVNPGGGGSQEVCLFEPKRAGKTRTGKRG